MRTRHEVLWIGLAASVLFLAACGDDGASEGSNPPSTTASSSTQGGTSETTTTSGETGTTSETSTTGGDTSTTGGTTSSGTLTFENDILPIFADNGCLDCHGENSTTRNGNHYLHSLEQLMTTGDHSPVVAPCNSDRSGLVLKLLDDPPYGSTMPLGAPRVPDADIAIIAAWIDQGADQEGITCEEGGPGVLPEVPPDLVERRTLRVSERTEMFTETLALPTEVLGLSSLFTQGEETSHGVLGAEGTLYNIPRSGPSLPVETGWTTDADLGTIFAASSTADGTLLVSSSEAGLLYLAEGALWPSPITDIINGDITAILPEQRIDARAQESVWFASSSGLYRFFNETLTRIGPPSEPANAPVQHITIGPHPEDGVAWAIWAAYGSKLYAVAPMVGNPGTLQIYPFEIDLGEEIFKLQYDDAAHVWALTSRGVFKRRPGPLTGISRWVSWELPTDEEPVDLVTDASGAAWLLTNRGLYFSRDGERWGAALNVPVTDVTSLAWGEGGSVWLSRLDRLVRAMETPVVKIAGVVDQGVYALIPNMQIYPAFYDKVSFVEFTLEGCDPIVLDEAPYIVTADDLIDIACEPGEGEHTITATAHYIHLVETATGSVTIQKLARPDDIPNPVTWVHDIEPTYDSYCGGDGCHATRLPIGYTGWKVLPEGVIDRILRPEGDPLKMPKSRDLPSAERTAELIRWWRADGFLFD